jgi:hypothetical protein
MPRNAIAKWSLGLIIAMPILFYIGMTLTGTLYEGVSSGDTLLADISARPALALSMLLGMACGISAFVTGMISITKHRERGILVYASTIIGAALILFLAAEVIWPH